MYTQIYPFHFLTAKHTSPATSRGFTILVHEHVAAEGLAAIISDNRPKASDAQGTASIQGFVSQKGGVAFRGRSTKGLSLLTTCLVDLSLSTLAN